MLTALTIQDFLTIEKVELTFKAGLSVFTGTTGAGKSLFMEAIMLGLGSRSDQNPVRPHAPHCQIALSFEIHPASPAAYWIQEQGFELEEVFIIRRTITPDNRSKYWMNGMPATAQQVKQVGRLLVSLYAQHQNQALTDSTEQQGWLDTFAQNGTLLSEVSDLFSTYHSLDHQLQQDQLLAETGREKKDLWQYQLAELEALQLTETTLENLHQEQHQLTHLATLQTAYQQALLALKNQERHAIYARLQEVSQQLTKVTAVAPNLAEPVAFLEQALIYVQEATDALTTQQKQLEQDPTRLQAIEAQLTSIHDLARKNRTTPEKLPQLIQELRGKIAAVEMAENRLAEIQQQQKAALAQYQEKAYQLSEARKSAAVPFAERLVTLLKTLGMEKARLTIQVEPLTHPHVTGLDKVTFTLSANPGQPLQPLSEIASGGELSRISLALHVSCRRLQVCPTLIFDEIDTGTGGSVGSAIGKCLQQLGQDNQVFCITHLPQVAVHGMHHFSISKTLSDQETHTHIDLLNETERLTEMSRMLAGSEITEETIAYAKALLQTAQEEPISL